MISGISGLNIKPLHNCSGETSNRTTITSFHESLESQQQKIEVSGRKDTVPETGTITGNVGGSTDNLYKDPVTGAEVRYVDVADKTTDKVADKTTDKTVKSSVSNKVTETADSMKTTKYDSYFKEAAIKYNVSESLLKGIAKAESDFDPNSLSGSGAMGIMQLMPETAKGLGVKDPYDPRQNILGGAKCISQKLEEFNGDVRLALAAYNAGSGAVKRAGSVVPSYCKTYVNRVISYKEAYETAKAVG